MADNQGHERGARGGRIRRTADLYRQVLAVTGAALVVVSFLGRLPVAVIQFGSVPLVAETSGSLATGDAAACAWPSGR
ncbi:hypothetical protein RB200_03665 [Streptomyces sp. PmtG]